MKKSAQDILFEHIALGTDVSKLNLDALCLSLHDEKAINAKNSQTDVTWLGLAIVFSRPSVVAALLAYGADVNLPTGLRDKENYLPLTLALALKYEPSILVKAWTLCASSLGSLVTPSLSVLDEILQKLIQHPNLDLRQKQSGKTVMKWVEEWKHKHVNASKEKALCQQLTLRFNVGIAEPLADFAVNGNTLHGVNTNKIKPYLRNRDSGPVIETGVWILKTLEKKDTFVPAKDQILIIDDTKHKNTTVADQTAWQTISADHSGLKCLMYQVGGRWWVCGRSEKSEILIAVWPSVFNLELTTKEEKVRVIEDMQGLFRFTRARREVVAMQWHQLFNSTQPRYLLAVGETMSTTAVAVKNIPGASNLNDFFARNSKSLPTYLEGLADVLCDIFITNDVDANLGNFLIFRTSKGHDIVHIDGDKCWAKLREYTEGDRFKVGAVFSELLRQKTDGEYDYFLWNFFDAVISGKKQDDAPIFEWIAGMIKTPRFKTQFHAAVLKRICLPESFIQHFISHYVTDAIEAFRLETALTQRLAEVKFEALADRDFKAYLKTSAATDELDKFMQQLVAFKTDDEVFLCAPHNQEYNAVWEAVKALVPGAAKFAAKKATVVASDIKVSAPAPATPKFSFPPLASLPGLGSVGPKKIIVNTPKPPPTPVPTPPKIVTPPMLETKVVAPTPSETKINIDETKINFDKIKPASSTAPINTVAELCHKLVVGAASDQEIIADITALYRRDIDLNTYDPATGATPLGLAITFILPEIVKALLNAGANPNLATGLRGKELRSPLIVAVGKGEPSDVKNLYSANPPQSSRGPKKGINYKALRSEMIGSLLDHPLIDLNYKDAQGRTVFDWAKVWQCAEQDKAVYATLLAAQADHSFDVSMLLTVYMMPKLCEQFASDEVKEEKHSSRLFARLLVAIHQHKWLQVVRYFESYLSLESPLINQDNLIAEFKSKCTVLLLTEKFRDSVIKQVGDADAQLFFSLVKQLPLPTDRPVEESLFSVAVEAKQTQAIFQLGVQHKLPIDAELKRVDSSATDSKPATKPDSTTLLLKLMASICEDGWSTRVRCNFENYVFQLTPTDKLEVFNNNWLPLLEDTMFQDFVSKQAGDKKAKQFFTKVKKLHNRVGIPSRLLTASEFKRSDLTSVNLFTQMSLLITHILFGIEVNQTSTPRDEAKLITEYYLEEYDEKATLETIIEEAKILAAEFKSIEPEVQVDVHGYHMHIARNLLDVQKTQLFINQICNGAITSEQLLFLKDKYLPSGSRFLNSKSGYSLYNAFCCMPRFLHGKALTLQTIETRMPALIAQLESYELQRQIQQMSGFNQFYIYVSPQLAGALYKEVVRRFKGADIALRFNTTQPDKLSTAMRVTDLDFKELTFDGKNATNDDSGYKVKLTAESLRLLMQYSDNASLLDIVHQFSSSYKTADGKLITPSTVNPISWFSTDPVVMWVHHADDLYQIISNTSWFDISQVTALTSKLTMIKTLTLYTGKFKDMIDALETEVTKIRENYKEEPLTQYRV